LPGYEPETLAKHVAEHYALQARVYGMAVRRESPDFGGVVFLFLRGPSTYFVPPDRAEWDGTGLPFEGGWSR
jgi:hypothetical protein